MLLGLKRDVRTRTNEEEVASPQDGHRVAQDLRCDKYMECSALSGELVREVFEDICRTAALTGKEGGGKSEGGCVVT